MRPLILCLLLCGCTSAPKFEAGPPPWQQNYGPGGSDPINYQVRNIDGEKFLFVKTKTGVQITHFYSN